MRSGDGVVAVLVSAAAVHPSGLRAELVLTRTMPRNQCFLHTLTLRSSSTLHKKSELCLQRRVHNFSGLYEESD